MAYQAFYNKYRPQTFGQVVGQKTIVATLENAIKEDKIAHAYLFCGPRGTGKTTMARLLAKALDCKEGLGKQCNVCDSCKAIMRGDHPDVIEIDAASNSTVDSVRDLVDNVSYQPIMSRYKVYIIDEVHNMSNSAFNALLKTLEEPPSFCVFILATTEPNKIIPTILSRVQRFDFSKVSNEDLIRNMENILRTEGVDYEPAALESIAGLSDGGVRDSLSLLDKLVSYSDGKVTSEDVNALFGLLSSKDEIEIVHLLNLRKADDLIHLVRDKYAHGMDIVRLHQDLITIYKDLILYKTTKDAGLLNKLTKEDCETFDIDLGTLQQTIRILIETKRDYRNSDNALSQLELALMEVILGPAPVMAPAMVSQPQAAQPTTAAIPAPAEKAGTPERTLASKAVVVQGTGEGFESRPEVVNDPTKENQIAYTIEDICNLMKLATSPEKVKERKELSQAWQKLETTATPDQFALSKALLSSKLRLIANDIVFVTNEMPLAKVQIDKKANQDALKLLMKAAFGKAYRVLAVTKDEFAQGYELFKKDKTPSHEPAIDFGDTAEKSTSTDFYNSLMAGN